MKSVKFPTKFALLTRGNLSDARFVRLAVFTTEAHAYYAMRELLRENPSLQAKVVPAR